MGVAISRPSIAGSISIPSFYRPVSFANHLLVDGGQRQPSLRFARLDRHLHPGVALLLHPLAFALARKQELEGLQSKAMELLTSGDYFRVLGALADRGKRSFVDLKFHDVPATVAATIRGLRRYTAGVTPLVDRFDRLGPILSALSGIPAVDIGNPMLSMHSCREQAATADVLPMIRALSGLFQDG